MIYQYDIPNINKKIITQSQDDLDNDDLILPPLKKQNYLQIDDAISDDKDDVITGINDFHNNSNDDENDICEILNHQQDDGICELKVKYYTDEEEYHPLELVWSDDPLQIAYYIIDGKDKCP